MQLFVFFSWISEPITKAICYPTMDPLMAATRCVCTTSAINEYFSLNSHCGLRRSTSELGVLYNPLRRERAHCLLITGINSLNVNKRVNLFSFSYMVAYSFSLPIRRRYLAQVQENLGAEVALRCVWLCHAFLHLSWGIRYSWGVLRYSFFVLLSIVVFYCFKLSSSPHSERNALKRKNHRVSKGKILVF